MNIRWCDSLTISRGLEWSWCLMTTWEGWWWRTRTLMTRQGRCGLCSSQQLHRWTCSDIADLALTQIARKGKEAAQEMGSGFKWALWTWAAFPPVSLAFSSVNTYHWEVIRNVCEVSNSHKMETGRRYRCVCVGGEWLIKNILYSQDSDTHTCTCMHICNKKARAVLCLFPAFRKLYKD